MLRASEPFCDFLSVSFPQGADDSESPSIAKVLDLLSPLGCVRKQDSNLFEVGAYGGTAKVFHCGRVDVLSFSGGVLRSMREAGILLDVSMCLNEVAHRVTRLDASCDFLVDAPPEIERFYGTVRQWGVSIGSKLVVDRDMTVYFGSAADGRRTGTIYLGGARAEIRGCIYDKRHERLQKGFPDPGPLLRIEVRMRSQVGCSVFDAVSPERVFYHYAAPGLCVPPAPVGLWGAYGAGFTLPTLPAKYTAAQRLMWLLDDSAVVKQMCSLTRDIGPEGVTFLFRKLRARCEALGSP